MKSSVTSTQIFTQLKADLIGKDSYRGVTQSYAWLANQFGHFSLGFIPAVVIYACCQRYSASNVSLAVALWWVAFETFNVIKSIYSSKQDRGVVFKPDTPGIVFDTITDLSFFSLGALQPALFVETSSVHILILCALLVVCSIGFRFWYPEKIFLQEGWLPFQFRISRWKGSFLDNNDASRIQTFISSDERSMHLIISGAQGSGKTSLAVGIASELAIKRQCVYYTSAIKWVNELILANDAPTMSGFWSRRRAHVLVIDDINPDSFPVDSWFTPNTAIHYLKQSNEINNIYHQKIIWVLPKPAESLFRAMLKDLGVPSDKILSVQLK
jgi:hypothetical protein